MARKPPVKKPGKQRGSTGRAESWTGRIAQLRQRLSPLSLAWVLLLVATIAAAGAFLAAYQKGGPRQGGRLSVALQSVETEASDVVAEEAVEAAASPRARGLNRRPRVAVVVTGLGLAQQITRRAIDELPASVALSFSPYAKDLGAWLRLAQEKGHEVLIDLPMEPLTFPKDDPGPKGLMTLLDAEQNLERLNWVLGRGQGYIGVAASMGSRFIASEKDLEPVLKVLKARGLLFLDNGSSEESVSGSLAKDLKLPHLTNDRALDDNPNRALIQTGLREVEEMAKAEGTSIALGQPYPATLESIIAWAADLESRGLDLATISSVAGLPPPRQAQHQADKDEQ